MSDEMYKPCGYPVMDCVLGVCLTKCEARIKKLEATLTEIISEYDEPDNGRYLRWAVDIARDVLKGDKT